MTTRGNAVRAAAWRDTVGQAVEKVQSRWHKYDAVVLENQRRVIAAMHDSGLGDNHFAGTTGYGYHDSGREVMERVFARVFGAEAAIVRPQLVSGTHAISTVLFGILRPGDKVTSISGAPYDTLKNVLWHSPGSLRNWGVEYEEVPLDAEGDFDLTAVLQAAEDSRCLMIQRSGGYSDRCGLSIAQIEDVVREVRKRHTSTVIFVDNCYGEFVETVEPTHVGVDIIAGSLIKNPGGGLALGGGYIAGRQDLVEIVSQRVTAPGLGSDVGPTFGQVRGILQGLFLAPHAVGEAVRGAVLTAEVLAEVGFEVSPAPGAHRTDIIQRVRMGSPEAVLAFCRAVQNAGPVDSSVRPEAAPMPGYDNDIVMAAGTFVQGASLELTADAPMRSPWNVFIQGGLTREHVIIALETILAALAEQGMISA